MIAIFVEEEIIFKLVHYFKSVSLDSEIKKGYSLYVRHFHFIVIFNYCKCRVSIVKPYNNIIFIGS